MVSTVFLVLVILFNPALALSSMRSKRPRRVMRWEPLSKLPGYLWGGFIDVKLKKGSPLHLKGQNIVNKKGDVVLSFSALLNGLPLSKVSQSFGLPILKVRALVNRARKRCGCVTGDLTLYFSFHTRANDSQRIQLLKRLNKHPLVEVAYPRPIKAAPPVDIAPATPDFSADQGYFAPAPTGIGLESARLHIGGRGEGIHFVDIEINFHPDHEDLERCVDALIPGVTGLYEEPDYTAHGTAVLGILFAGDNGYGVTGSIPDGICHFSPNYTTTWGNNVAKGITNAMLNVDSPAILQLESQEYGPNWDPDTYMGLVPSEWLPAVYDVVATATAAGYVVVAAAGNGNENLDDPIYQGAFDLELADSGAIIVGAGTSPQVDGTGRQREWYSNYGTRVDVHGWGSNVTTTGYGDLFTGGGDINQYYTAQFAGTSSGSPVVGSAVALLLGILRGRGYDYSCTIDDECDEGLICDTISYGTPRCIENNSMDSMAMRHLLRATGSPQLGDTTERIGPLPDLQAAIDGLSICGDSVINGLEVCDDGNSDNRDGCSSDCLSDETCGNSITDVMEMCDDGNSDNGDGCSSNCLSDETCGNGIVDLHEMCDDGNSVGRDGCSMDCLSDETCGNGVVDLTEVCDDGNLLVGDGCNSTCISIEICGNHIVDFNEDCDDGNLLDGDECPSICQFPKKDEGCSCSVPGNSSSNSLPFSVILISLLGLAFRIRKK
jgi:serine protease